MIYLEVPRSSNFISFFLSQQFDQCSCLATVDQNGVVIDYPASHEGRPKRSLLSKNMWASVLPFGPHVRHHVGCIVNEPNDLRSNGTVVSDGFQGRAFEVVTQSGTTGAMSVSRSSHGLPSVAMRTMIWLNTKLLDPGQVAWVGGTGQRWTLVKISRASLMTG